MSGSTADRDPFERLAEDFFQRLRRGEHPAITDYIARHPELADDIRELFPEIAAVEQCKPPELESMTPPGAISPRPGHLPEQLGDYRILRCLGSGGMGVVYEAVRVSLRNNVALKVMHPQFRDREQYERRFRTEARSAARLHHTNIVSVFDYGVHDGVCYYAMQFIAGHSLDKILADVRHLRREKSTVTAEAPAIAPETQAVSRGEPGLTPRFSGDAPTYVSSRSLSLGLVTGEWAVAASTRDLEAGEAQSPHAATVVVEERANVHSPEAGDRNGFQRTALRRLAAELAASDDPTLGPRQPEVEDDSPASDPAVPSGSGSSLTARGEVRYYREIARLGAQVADALDHAHKRGVLHRDIKPSNLILDGLGNIWITDFGLAKFDDGEDLSHSQDLVGTLRFMAPERFRGGSDPRCDVYALGATLYEMLTLRPCFSGESHAQLMHRIEHEPPRPPRQIMPGIPADLETIVLKALAKAPGDRFETAEEMAAELRRYVENRPIRSRPIPAYQRFWRWCARNPLLAAAGMTAAAATIALAIVMSVAARVYHQQVEALEAEQEQTRNAERKARLELGNSLVTEGTLLQRSGLMGQRFDSLDRLGHAARILGADLESRRRLPEIRDHVIAGLGLVDLRVRLFRDVGNVRALCFDAALERYAFREPSGEVVVSRLEDGQELWRFSIPGSRDYLTAVGSVFSPDGGLLVTIDQSPSVTGLLMRVWDTERRELFAEVATNDYVRFDYDGRRIAFGAPEGGVAIWDRHERRVVRRLPLDFPPGHLGFDPAGRRIAVANRDRTAPRVVILDAETGQLLADWRNQVGFYSPSWSADGQLLAVGGVGGEDPLVYVWNVERQALQSVLRGHNGMVDHLEFAHSGYLIATAGDGSTRLWDAASGEPLALVPEKQFSNFSPDDNRLTFTGGGIGVWDVSTAPERLTLHAGMTGNRAERRVDGGIRAVEFSPDAKLLATAGYDGVRLWDADSGRELGHLKAGTFCRSVLFDSDGRGVITYGGWGVYRWPIRPDSARGADAVSIGPPELLWESLSNHEFNYASWLPDRRTLAIADNARAKVMLVDTRGPHPALSRANSLDAGGNQAMTSVAVSPDGNWLAVGGWYTPGITVWNLPQRRFERILRPSDAVGITKFFVSFSPDGRWLISNTNPDNSPFAYHFWRPGTWELDRRIGAKAAGDRSPFTGDSRLMALANDHKILLAEAITGKELARLSTVQLDDLNPLTFSPDGTKLVVGVNGNLAHVWDLRRVRAQLAPMGLDWDAPAYPAANKRVGPRTPRSVRVLGEVRENGTRRAAELAEMNRRLAADPNDAEALLHRGWLRLNLSKPNEAVADLEQLMRLLPDDTDALFLLSQAHTKRNDLRSAMAALESYLKRCPEDTDARIKKGLLSLALGQQPEAVDEFSRVLEADPGRTAIRFRRAKILFRLGRFAEAVADLDAVIKRFPEDPDVYELRGQIHDALGDQERATADRKRAAELPQGDANDYNTRAWNLATGPAAQRDPDEALAAARKAVSLAPGMAIYLNTLGVAQFRAGLYADAIATLEKSLAASNGQSDAFDLFFLAMTRRKLGQIERARADFDRALRWRRDHPKLSQRGWPEELDRFQAEAEAALSEWPDDIFAPTTELRGGP
jgi:serine/threonine protein kinase/WD40 repeat protein/tetratricopeptide (TPR) repeat protein